MMQESENPPAFPQLVGISTDQWSNRHGMTLRDWFAGQALAGIASQPQGQPAEQYAIVAYKLSDAMLRERGK